MKLNAQMKLEADRTAEQIINSARSLQDAVDQADKEYEHVLNNSRSRREWTIAAAVLDTVRSTARIKLPVGL